MGLGLGEVPADLNNMMSRINASKQQRQHILSTVESTNTAMHQEQEEAFLLAMSVLRTDNSMNNCYSSKLSCANRQITATLMQSTPMSMVDERGRHPQRAGSAK